MGTRSRILVLLTRHPCPKYAVSLEPGAEVFALPHKDGDSATAADALKNTLRVHGVDVLVNPDVGRNYQMESLLMEAASPARVCVYLNIVTSDDQATDPQRSAASSALRPDEGSKNMQIVSVNAGLFMEAYSLPEPKAQSTFPRGVRHTLPLWTSAALSSSSASS